MESEKKEIKEIEQRDKLLEQFVHPYFDEEPDIEKDKFVVSDLVSRGCSKEPISYRPVSKKELDNCALDGLLVYYENGGSFKHSRVWNEISSW